MELNPVNCGCGGKAQVFFPFANNSIYMIECKKCGICTSAYETETEAIQAWNKAMNERTAKVKDLDRRSETSMSWEGICTKCGSYTMHGMNYCFYCGARLEWE